MYEGIRLSALERKTLLQEVRRGTDPERRLRAHLLLLLDDGWAWSVIVAVLFTSSSTINRWRQQEISRNHRCQNLEELLDLVFHWLASAPYFDIETSVYEAARAA